MTQSDQILHHMRARGSITPLLALKRYGCLRLAARIHDLEREGHLINHAWVRRGGKKFVAYSLVEGARRAA